MANLEHLEDLLAELELNPIAQGWGTKWQHVCEIVWKLSANHDSSIPTTAVDTFIALLSDESRFSLARLIIAELRDPVPHSQYPQQQQVLQATQKQRANTARQESAVQTEVDDIMYVAEKRILLDAELHRARVLLHQSGAYGSESEDKIRRWLAAHPDLLPSAGSQDESGSAKKEAGGQARARKD